MKLVDGKLSCAQDFQQSLESPGLKADAMAASSIREGGPFLSPLCHLGRLDTADEGPGPLQ